MKLYKKLLEVKKDLGTLKKDKVNPFFSKGGYKATYVDINGVLEVLNPILEKHGVLLLQPLLTVEGVPHIATELIDVDTGNKISRTVALLDPKDAQKFGAICTYYRRFSIIAMLSLGAEDCDGETAMGRGNYIPQTPITKTDAYQGSKFKR